MDRAEFRVGVDPAHGDDRTALGYYEFRDGNILLVSLTTDEAEIASLLADCDFVTDGPQ